MEMVHPDEYENILLLGNVVEANLMETLLRERGIVFFIRCWRDAGLAGIRIDQKGWGWLMARKKDREQIRHVYEKQVLGSQEEN